MWEESLHRRSFPTAVREHSSCISEKWLTSVAMHTDRLVLECSERVEAEIYCAIRESKEATAT